MGNNLLPTLATSSLWMSWPTMQDNKPLYNLVFAGQALARLLGSIILIPCQDLIGRRNQLLLCGLVLFIFTGVTPLCTAFWAYVAIRFLASFGAAALPSTCQVFAIEVSSLKHRALAATSVQFWQVSQTMILSGFNIPFFNADPVNSWKHLYASSLGFPFLGLVFLGLVLRVESPRYVAARGHHTRTWLQLCRLTPGGASGLGRLLQVPDVYACRLKDVENDPQPDKNLFEIVVDNFRRMFDCVKDKAYRHDSIVISLLWATTAIGFWGFTTYMTTFFSYIELTSTTTTFYCQAVQLPGFVFVWWLMQRDGRFGGRLFALRFTALWTFIGLIGLVVTIVVSIETKPVLLLFSLWTYALTNPMWCAIYIFSTERYPTTHRGAAMALFSTVNSICTFVTTFIGSVSITPVTAWRYPLIWACCYLASTIVACLLRAETRSQNLANKMERADTHNTTETMPSTKPLQ
eukprot:Protomagalhaensia_sp_Gyna_25__5933@NODE_909_length_2432_cov_894_104471_g716_i0_p1_GENE_NODE_909_length_2432_cov_894_104471_g716_i0NODE_909_length_2432_cov_894_104471_g716_i0_p1_ORF_typecomplete_len463_score49_00Sugar_tr/PF00083_24/1_2e45MFS_1/PF07690_16/5_6e19MFS_1/PF07690_16/1_5e08TRI12/PF06609_13/3_3e08TRI12/PF06609_13/1_8e04TRI12/PF06609_13/1MFS_3/PF05977_13/0_27MFS_3/PF05977_13/9_8e05_NODE_909_length_2432_cov_894_104471_g716_i02791667